MWQPIWNRTEEDGLPQDLRAWVDGSILVSLVLSAVQAVCESEHDSQGADIKIPAGLPRTLLTILTYSYAIGIYASEEIEARILSDPELRYLSAGARPTWHDLRRFRRQQRQLVCEALSQTLRLVWEFRLWSIAHLLHIDSACCDPIVTPDGADQKHLVEAARSAEDRVNQAILRDSTALDV